MIPKLLVIVALGAFPKLVCAQSDLGPSNATDDILQSLAQDEKLTWMQQLPAKKGGPNAEFSLDTGALAEPAAAPAPPPPPMRDDDKYGPQSGDFEFTLAGSGVSDKRVENSVANVAGSLGFYLVPAIELVVRQDFVWIKDGHSDTSAASRAALDFHLDLDVLQPFVGGNFGYVYGELVKDTFEAAPEGGLKLFVKNDTFLFGMVEYRFFFRHGDDAEDAFRDGQWVYSVGVGFTF